LSGLGSLLGSSSASSAASTSTAPAGSLTSWINNLTNTLSNSPLNSNIANLGQIQMGTWASACSDLIGMGGGGMLTALADPAGAAADLGGLGAGLDGAFAPVGAGGIGGAPVLAGVGQASPIGALSVPPSWAGNVPAASATPGMLTGAGWTTAAPGGAPVTAMPAGMPSVASAGRGGFGCGAPRYGVKPKVMPRPTVV
jgi:PPE-repeat protein